jgi:hypothetical protein
MGLLNAAVMCKRCVFAGGACTRGLHRYMRLLEEGTRSYAFYELPGTLFRPGATL